MNVPRKADRPATALTLIDVELRDGHGVDDYESDAGESRELRALRDGQVIGTLTYNLCDDYARVRWVEVDEACQRNGVARALITELVRLHPGLTLSTGGFTDSGQELFDSLDVDITEEADPERDDD